MLISKKRPFLFQLLVGFLFVTLRSFNGQEQEKEGLESPAKSHEIQPSEVYDRLVDCFKSLQNISLVSGLELLNLDLNNPKLKEMEKKS